MSWFLLSQAVYKCLLICSYGFEELKSSHLTPCLKLAITSKEGESKGKNIIFMQFSRQCCIEYSLNVNKSVLPLIKTQTWHDRIKHEKAPKLSRLTPLYGIFISRENYNFRSIFFIIKKVLQNQISPGLICREIRVQHCADTNSLLSTRWAKFWWLLSWNKKIRVWLWTRHSVTLCLIWW